MIMNKIMIKFFVTILAILLLNTNYAQQRYKSERNADIIEYTVKEGLPITSISKISQTDDNYVWISGLEGTVRFNGYDFEEVNKEIELNKMQFHYYDTLNSAMYFASPTKFISFKDNSYKVYTENDGYKINGLPGRYISFIDMDSKGRIWIGSATLFVDSEFNGGITMFDGNNFTVHDSSSFPLHNATQMFETPYGELVISSAGKNTRTQDEAYIALFKDDEFIRVDESYGVSLQGNIFSGTTLLTTYSPPTIDNEGNTWISFAGSGSLFEVEKNTSGVLMYDGAKFHQYPGLDKYLIGNTKVSSVFYLNSNKTIYASLANFNGETYSPNMNLLFKFVDNSWEKVNIFNETGPIQNLNTGVKVEKYQFTFAKFIKKTNIYPDLLIIGSVQETGVGAQNDQYFYFDNGWKKYDAFVGFPVGTIKDAALIGTTRGFSFYYPNKSILLTENDGLINVNDVVPTLYSDLSSLVWIYHSSVELPSIIQINEEGLNVWDGEKLITLTTEDGLSSNLIYSIEEDSKGRIWAATQNGLSFCRTIKNSQDEWVIKANHVPSLENNDYSVSHILETKDGSIYAWQNYVRPASPGIPKTELYFGKLNGEIITEINSDYLKEKIGNNKYQFLFLRELPTGGLLLEAIVDDDNRALASNRTEFFTYDGENWAPAPESWKVPEKHLKYVGTIENKMYYLSPGYFYNFDGNSFVDLSDSVNANADFRILKEASSAGTVTHIQAGNYLYIRVRLKGLVIFDGTNLNFYTTQNGLPTANIFNPMIDKKGKVYFAHQFGGIVISGEQFNVYFNEDINEGRESGVSVDVNDDFVVFYTGLGLYVDRDNDLINDIKISSVAINDRKYFQNIPASLNYESNSFLFNYTSLNYKNSDETNFQHMLEGYDLDWSRLSNLQFTEYQNLPPGEYNFKVRAALGISEYSDEATYSFVIVPPYWRTWWAYICYFLIFFGFLYSVRKFEIKRQKKNNAIKESKLRAEAAELQAKAAEAQSKVIQAENDRKSEELEEARQLQLSLLPKDLPKVENLDIAFYMKTATEVGGDYYDYSLKEDGSLNIAIGDATGHGMKAGTLVSMMKSLFTANSVDKNIVEFFKSSNSALKKSNLERMMLGFAMITVKGDKAEFVNAGLPSVYHYIKSKNIIEELNVHSLPLGAMSSDNYIVTDIKLDKDDVLLMLTDGFPELQNEKEELYGYERVISSFEKVTAKSPDEIINYLKDEGSKWVKGNDPDDDVTFVVIKVK